MSSQEPVDKLGMSQLVEQYPFYQWKKQRFLETMFAIFDSVHPKFIKRGEWENMVHADKPIIEQDLDGEMKTMSMPEDVRLWEVPTFMHALNMDTYFDDPEKAIQKKELLIEQGRIIQNVGTYIAQRMGGVEEGREIAEHVAKQFYSYGRALQTNNSPESITDINSIASKKLSKRDTEVCDEYLATPDVLTIRSKRALELSKDKSVSREEAFEEQRQSALSQYFRLLSISLNNVTEGNNKHELLARKATESFKEIVEAPLHQLYWSIFQRGMVKLVKDMSINKHGFEYHARKVLSGLGFDTNPNITITERYKLDESKQKLTHLRSTGDEKALSDQEYLEAMKVSKITSSFRRQYRDYNFLPSRMLKDQNMQCIGFSTYASVLLTELGIKNLFVSVNGHTKVIFRTQDQHFYWLEPQAEGAIEPVDFGAFVDENGKMDGHPFVAMDHALDSPRNKAINSNIPTSLYKRWFGQDKNIAPSGILPIKIAAPEIGLKEVIIDNVIHNMYYLGSAAEGSINSDIRNEFYEVFKSLFYQRSAAYPV